MTTQYWVIANVAYTLRPSHQQWLKFKWRFDWRSCNGTSVSIIIYFAMFCSPLHLAPRHQAPPAQLSTSPLCPLSRGAWVNLNLNPNSILGCHPEVHHFCGKKIAPGGPPKWTVTEPCNESRQPPVCPATPKRLAFSAWTISQWIMGNVADACSFFCLVKLVANVIGRTGHALPSIELIVQLRDRFGSAVCCWILKRTVSDRWCNIVFDIHQPCHKCK